MDTYRERVEHLLKSNKATLIRKKKHHIWIFPSGKRWVTPSTPSDHRAWQNNYAELRLYLGQKTTVKTQSDFDHQKKEPYEPKHIRFHDFLGDLPDREVLPAPPPAPDKGERELLAKAKARLAEEAPYVEREVFPLQGHFPLVVRKGTQRIPGGRTTQAYTFSKEVLAHANHLMMVEGEDSCKRYLDAVRAGVNTAPQKLEEQENDMTVGLMPKVVGNGSIESIVQEKREELRQARQLVERQKLEVTRLEGVVQLLEEAFNLTTASAETLRAKAPSNGNGLIVAPSPATPNGVRVKWQSTLREVIGTSPEPLTRGTLVAEIQKIKGDETNRAAYQVVWNSLKSGFLAESEDGVVTVAQQ